MPAIPLGDLTREPLIVMGIENTREAHIVIAATRILDQIRVVLRPVTTAPPR
jgi:hypothetical protein